MIRNFGGVTGTTNQPQGLDIGLGGGSNTKSIQRGQAAFGSGLTTLSVVITSIVPANSIVRFSVYSNITGAAITDMFLGATITDATHINFVRPAAAASANLVISWEVIEFAGVKSKQSGVTNVPDATTVNLTITAVVVNKCILVASNTTNLGDLASSMVQTFLSSTTIIQFQTVGTGTRNTYWQLIEFN